nr:MAG TPA: hypothetical protein [Caudoviricetes sp.]
MEQVGFRKFCRQIQLTYPCNFVSFLLYFSLAELIRRLYHREGKFPRQKKEVKGCD